MKKHFFVTVLVIITILLLASCSCEHKWVNATCTTPASCIKCGETAGDPIGHIWNEATCIVAKTCAVCNVTDGEVAGHKWIQATCTVPKKCSICELTEGEPLGHKWEDATCTSPKKCSNCKLTEGTTLSHAWEDATCTSPKKCSNCKLTEGTTLSHTWEDATCTSPKKCSKCGTTDGNCIDHVYKNNKCKMCGITDPAYAKLTEFNSLIKIYGTYIYVDSADGVSVYLTWENKSSKEIKYVSFSIELYNRVNDRLKCNITGRTSVQIKQTGPFPKGKGMYHCSGITFGYPNDRHFMSSPVTYDEYYSDKDNGWAGLYWDNVWYNSSAHYIKIVGVQIDYMDGSRYSIYEPDFFNNLGIINLTVNDSIYDY